MKSALSPALGREMERNMDAGKVPANCPGRMRFLMRGFDAKTKPLHEGNGCIDALFCGGNPRTLLL